MDGALRRQLAAIQQDRQSGASEPEVWKHPPAGVFVLNAYFERTLYSPGIRVLTERGWMTPQAVGKAAEKIPVSARLLAMAD